MNPPKTLTAPTITWYTTGMDWQGTSSNGYEIYIGYNVATDLWCVERLGAIPRGARRGLWSGTSLRAAKMWVEDWLAEPGRRNGR